MRNKLNKLQQIRNKSFNWNHCDKLYPVEDWYLHAWREKREWQNLYRENVWFLKAWHCSNWLGKRYATRAPLVKRRLHTMIISVKINWFLLSRVAQIHFILFFFDDYNYFWIFSNVLLFLFTGIKVQHMFQPWKTFVKIRDICRWVTKLVEKEAVKDNIILLLHKWCPVIKDSVPLRNYKSDLEPNAIFCDWSNEWEIHSISAHLQFKIKWSMVIIL